MSAVAGETAVMCGHALLAQTLGELMGESLGHAPRVHEDKRRLMLPD